jgi:D-3-phosphoglycerate dehydrogenase
VKIVVANYNIKAQYLVDDLQNWCDDNGHILIAESHLNIHELIRICQNVEVLIATQALDLGADFFRAVPQLKLIIAWGSGYEQLDLEAASEMGIKTANAGLYSNPDVAEIALIHILCASRKISGHLQLVRENRWGDRTELRPMHRMEGRTVGLLGFGNIARDLCWRLHGLRFRVVAADPYVSAQSMMEHGVEKKEVKDLLRESDFVSIHLRVTEDTYHIIDNNFLSLMKPGAFLINVSRGALVDEQALLKALTTGTLAGAGLDVLEIEPPAVDHPLLSLPQVMITPHCGAGTEQSKNEHTRSWTNTIEDYLANVSPIRNQISPLPRSG